MRALNVFLFACALVISTLGACAWGDGSGTEGDDGPDPLPAPVCGDGICAGSEIGVCTADCGGPAGPRCGNGMCENGESTTTCANDCPAQSQCGNGTCNTGETNANCPADCPAQSNCPSNANSCLACALFGQLCPSGQTMATCMTCILGGGGGTCSGGFPNMVCDAGENSTNCPFDCP